MGLSHSPRIVTNGLTTLFDAANSKSYPQTGSSWLDISSFAQTGTLVNSPTFEANNGGCFNFSAASNNYVTIPHNANAQATSAVTASIMVYKSNWATSSERIFSKTQGGSYALVTDNTAGRLSSLFYIAGSYRIASIPLTSLSGNWQYFTTSCDGRYVKLYVNGNLANTYDFGSQNTVTYTSAQLVLGAEPAGPSSIDHAYTKLTGKIASFSIYNRMLSDAEITQNFQAIRGRFGL